MVINIMLSVNQAECDRTSERIKAVLDYKRSIGEVTSGKCACYGYKVENNRLVKDASVSHIIDDAYDHYFSCYSIRSTFYYLKSKYGADAPSHNKVDRLFKNETYAGKDKDKEGKVISVNQKDGTVLVEGVNMLTKHTKPTMANQNGGIVHQEGPIDISNVMYIHKGKATRIGFKMDGDKKVRVAKSTGEVID